MNDPNNPPWQAATPDLLGKRAAVAAYAARRARPDPFIGFMSEHVGAAHGRTLAACALLAGLVTFVLTGGPPGAGVTLAGWGTLAAGLLAGPRDRRVERGTAALLTAALFAVPAFLDARWIVALTVLAGLGTMLAAFAPPRRLPSFVLGPLFLPLHGVAAIAWAVRGLRRLPGRGRIGRVIASGLAAVVLCAVFGGLFAAADPAFADLLDTVLPAMPPDLVVIRIVLFPIALFGVLGTVHVAAGAPKWDLVAARPPRPVRRWEWALPLALLDLLFAAFVAVQAVSLFAGRDYIERTTGLSYAEYARGGFWQLCWVSALTIAVIAVTARYAPRRAPADRLLVRLLLGSLCVLSLLVVISALHRMSLYEQAYGLTRLRLWIFAVELWLGLVFVLIAAAGVRLRARRLVQIIAATGAAALLALAALDPDALIAERNIDRYAHGGDLDVAYLARLSADAVPALDALPPELRDEVLDRMECREARGGLSWNLSRALLDGERVGCPG